MIFHNIDLSIVLISSRKLEESRGLFSGVREGGISCGIEVRCSLTFNKGTKDVHRFDSTKILVKTVEICIFHFINLNQSIYEL